MKKPNFDNFTTEEIKKLSLAVRMTGVACDNAAIETILLVQQEVSKKGGKFSLLDACEIQAHIEEKYYHKKKK